EERIAQLAGGDQSREREAVLRIVVGEGGQVEAEREQAGGAGQELGAAPADVGPCGLRPRRANRRCRAHEVRPAAIAGPHASIARSHSGQIARQSKRSPAKARAAAARRRPVSGESRSSRTRFAKDSGSSARRSWRPSTAPRPSAPKRVLTTGQPAAIASRILKRVPRSE